jgi:alpha-N-arabinofuranosidase
MELPASGSIAGGLAIFQDSGFNYFLGVQKTAETYTIELEAARAGVVTTLASAVFTTLEKHIVLGLEQRGAKLSFYYALADTGRIELITDVDAKLLSTEVAGGFVGATVGMHARTQRRTP